MRVPTLPGVLRPLLFGCLVLSGRSSAREAWDFTIEGHARTMAEAYRNIDFGLGDIDDDSWLHQRVQAMFAVSYDERLRLVSEFSWGDMWGRRTPLGPPDRDDGDFLQLFAEGRFDLSPEDSLSVRIGRQTFQYGSGRLLSRREGANQRLAHDAALVSWENESGAKIDTFIASPVATGPGLFDNDSHPEDLKFWSIYAVLPSPWHAESHFDLYYIGLDDRNSIFADDGRELRHTVGIRWWDETGPWLDNTEFMFQFGKAGDRRILAGAISLGLGYQFMDAPWKPTLMLRADAISGGDDSGALHTFHPLFQANNYFNEGGLVSPSNLYNLNPVLVLEPHPKVSLQLGVNFQWRFSADDALYAPPLQQLGPSAPGTDRYLGTAFNLSVGWQCHESAEIGLGFTHHEAGPSLKAIGGQDVDYLQATFRLSF